ncbi:hypothetical protein GFS24_08205 [Chitinophaga sp. SYP-B3965]|uniref:hypothetical protein n=1 Tax=Chitinophaga sp. SYP-B3965 TaxID=2663120 RepID=UPI001299EE4E|nr:hypothetical protein [Chitinophaga sp. SYP-B3965]MRG45094.1 hypothetical protein [Chitinophaga sp. SYP-B3965]
MNLFDQIEKHFISNNFSERDRKNVKWTVSSSDGDLLYIDGEGYTKEKDNEFTEFPVSQMVDSIYSRMRNIPYNNHQIITAISKYLTIVQFGAYEVIEDAVGIEFEGGSVRNRGFCSSKKIYGALRSDFFNLINQNKLNSSNRLEIRDTIFCARHVKTSYVFENFIDVFAEEIIPTIAALAIEGLVIVVNPMRIEILGES